jgi:hypothetical protein
VPGQSGIYGFEFIQQVQPSSFSIEEELLRITQGTEVLGEDFVLRTKDILHFS